MFLCFKESLIRIWLSLEKTNSIKYSFLCLLHSMVDVQEFNFLKPEMLEETVRYDWICSIVILLWFIVHIIILLIIIWGREIICLDFKTMLSYRLKAWNLLIYEQLCIYWEWSVIKIVLLYLKDTVTPDLKSWIEYMCLQSNFEWVLYWRNERPGLNGSV